MLAVLAAASARAGQYHVYSCRQPSGQSAPTDGWSGSVAAGGSVDDYALDTCAQGGALVAALGDETKHLPSVDFGTWTFGAPLGETIAAATVWRSGDIAGGGGAPATYQFWLSGPTDGEAFDSCVYSLTCPGEGVFGMPFSPGNRVVVPHANLGGHLYLNVSCTAIPGNECPGGVGDANGYADAVYLYAADIVLEQLAGPTAGNVGGELASATTLRGSSDIAFSASDPGSGVYEALFSVDGQVVQRTVLDENGGRCENVGQTTDGLSAFLYVQPCPPSVSVDVPFDTTRVANGAHHLVVSVIDAAGNAAVVLDRQITVSNPPPPGAPNGVGASVHAVLSARWRSTTRARLTSPYGRSHTIEGRLTAPGGAPIEAAEIDVSATPSSEDARAIAMASPRTARGGRFTLRLPASVSSRTLRIAYRAHFGETVPVATRTLQLAVAAGVHLAVSPHTTGVGQTIFFTGRLLGAPLPLGGKQLVLEASSPGGPWLQFDVIRTHARGRFNSSYTFKFPGPADYRFRAVSEPEADYPFSAGASNTVGVHEQ